MTGRWTWADFAFVDGLCAAISLWQADPDAQRPAGHLEPQQRAPAHTPGGLTERQQAILALIREGRSNASIAKTLGYSISTVKNEVQTLIALMGVSNRRQVVERAEQAGLTERPSRGSTAEAPDAELAAGEGRQDVDTTAGLDEDRRRVPCTAAPSTRSLHLGRTAAKAGYSCATASMIPASVDAGMVTTDDPTAARAAANRWTSTVADAHAIEGTAPPAASPTPRCGRRVTP